MGEVVTNTSPLLYLHQLGLLDLLRRLYGRVTVPRCVVEELDAGRAKGHDVPEVANIEWLAIVSSSTVTLLALAADLGRGESEAIAIAHQNKALLVLDDALARRHADLLGVACIGTLGVLLKGKEAGHLTEVNPLVEALMRLGFHLSSRTIEAVLRLAGED
jgi:predicted nucleic acid-binding protein